MTATRARGPRADATRADATRTDVTRTGAGRAGGARVSGLLRWPVRAASLATALLAWQILTAANVRFWVRFDRFPGPMDVLREFGRQVEEAQFWQDIAQSLVRILTGFALAAVLGVVLGVATARSRWAGDLLQPLFEVARPIPAIALVPVAILLFPANEQGIVFITFAAAFFPVLVSTRHAVKALPVVWEDAVRTLGAGRRRVLLRVVLPGVLPGVFGGLSIGMGVAWICVISAEMISGDFGVGYRTWQAYTIVDYPGVLVGMATIGLLGWLTSAAVEVAGRRLTRWLPREER
ncbi:ABC transporter permease [Actinomadura litoris]|uniref:ABC transporter permease subunit n=1 Tax=Actinomadura litoris TaxID=2678616 RepID=A0A7K1L7A7_9ACTN|nr:ABC transporter permease [Actinomadura litoris]MUN40314.1 ABC transporter permease subunit [Actinomadura litoris]